MSAHQRQRLTIKLSATIAINLLKQTLMKMFYPMCVYVLEIEETQNAKTPRVCLMRAQHVYVLDKLCIMKWCISMRIMCNIV